MILYIYEKRKFKERLFNFYISTFDGDRYYKLSGFVPEKNYGLSIGYDAPEHN